jgi:phosphoribosylformylglycinamidine synthase PurS subunit
VSDSIWRVELVVLPKDGVNDPQGEAVRGGLAKLGHGSVDRVRVGRHIQIDVRGPSEADVRAQVQRMADELLANPVIEQFEIAKIWRQVQEEVA